ncbi:MAG: hypothetical protein IPI34_13515 [bacterium]|nr:hypothetical protein [bacterium]
MNPHHPAWAPPHCPNPNCKYHNTLQRQWRFKRLGFYTRRCAPHRIQRYLCLDCRVSFSRQTFDTTYWLKRPEILPNLFMKTVGAMANRQIARDLQAAPATIDNQLARLGRHCLLFHAQRLAAAPLAGDLVIDGFESFEFSQYHPFHHHLAVEADTSFVRYFTDSELRRKGRMTEYQKSRRRQLESRLGTPEPGNVRRDVQEMLEVALRDSTVATVRSDDHRTYPYAMREVPCCIDHMITSAKRRRTARNPLFEANLLDLLVRHSQAGHRRETISWPKRRQGSAERLAILVVWRNYIKRRREKGPPDTPAMLKGIEAEPLSAKGVLAERLFRSRIDLPPRWGKYYDRTVVTREFRVNRRHKLKRAR